MQSITFITKTFNKSNDDKFNYNKSKPDQVLNCDLKSARANYNTIPHTFHHKYLIHFPKI